MTESYIEISALESALSECIGNALKKSVLSERMPFAESAAELSAPDGKRFQFALDQCVLG